MQGGVVYVGGGDANWYALDATTGAILWSVYTGDNSATSGHYNWASPLIYNGSAYIGIASLGDCPLVQGQLLRVDLTTHQIVATFNVVPSGQVGGGIWTSPTLDTATNTIYVTTGTESYTTQSYAQALLALDGTTLALKDSWKLPESAAVPDSDFGTTPILFSDTAGDQLVGAINKNGVFYAFQRNNLAGGPFWQQQIAVGGDCPQCSQGSVSSSAFANGLLYVSGGNTEIGGQGASGSVRALNPATGAVVWAHATPEGIIAALAYANGLVIDGAGKTLEVLDASNGTRLYSYTLGGTIYAAPSVAQGMIFTGGVDGGVYAFGPAATTPPPADANCPTGWTCQDIGGPTPAGSETVSAGAWTVSAGGAGVGGTTDQFRLMAQTFAGDSQVIARIPAGPSPAPSAQAGIMLRQSADPGSPYYALFVTANSGLVAQYRTQFGGATTAPNTISKATLPLYIEIQRIGDQIQAATSSDGVTYPLIPGTTATVVMPATVWAGLLASSGANGTPSSASFAAVTAGAPTGTPAPAPSSTPCPAGWSCADVGNPLLAGTQTLSAGTWTVQGAGNDIWGASDQFHYVWQPFSADATATVHVASQTNTDPWAKAGVMLRQGTGAGAAFYAAYTTPSNGLTVQYRPVSNYQAQTQVNVTTTTAPIYLRVARMGTSFTTYTSTDGIAWTALAGSTITLTYMGGSILAGFAVTSHNGGALSSVTADMFSVAAGAPAPCPASWSCADIGYTTPAGSQNVSSTGVWTVQGAGSDIWGTSDQFHYAWQSLAGDGTVSTHVTSQTNTSAWAKAGVMLRLSSDPAAPFYALYVTPSNGLSVQYRATAGASASQAALISGNPPVYFQIARAGTNFTAYTSTDGITWTLVPGSKVTLASLSGSILAGLAVTSHNGGTLSTVTFDTVSISAGCVGGWTCADIGYTTPTGSQSVSNAGVWTVQGAGSDIWGTSDQFHYAWQALPGDGTLSAHMTSQTNTDPWAKAGVMLRLSSDPAAPFYALFVTPGNGLTVQYRATVGANAIQLVNVAGATPIYLRVGRSGTTFTAYTSTDGVTWTALAGSAITLSSLSGSLLAGLAVTSHNGGALSTVTFDTVTANAAPPPPPPCVTGWSCADIGYTTPAGSQSLSATGVWTVQGAGSDIWGTSDQFHYAWQALPGDGTVSAHVTSQTNTSAWAKAGVMLRLSSDPAAPFYALYVTPSNGVVVQYRATAGGNASQAASIAGATPVYLRVGRSGTTFTAYTSPDGTTWTAIAGSTVTLSSLSGSLLAGLAVTSHNGGALSSVTFDTVSITSTSTPPPPPPACVTGWSCADIGYTTPAGSQSLSSAGVWTVQGAGSDIWGTSDQFHYVWQSMPGNGTFSTQVTSQTNTSGWAKAGVMLRLSSDPAAPFYALYITPGNGLTVQYRATAGANVIDLLKVAGVTPVYLRVGRSSTTFTAYTSTDGTTWTAIAGSTVTLANLAGTILQGIAVTSHNASTLCTVTFASTAVAATAAPVVTAPQQPAPLPTATTPTSPIATATRRKP